MTVKAYGNVGTGEYLWEELSKQEEIPSVKSWVDKYPKHSSNNEKASKYN